MTLPGTSVQASLRGITATSIDGSEISFEQTESTSINLSEDTYLTEPRMIASRVNEVAKNTTQPGGKSMELTFTLSTANANVSPVIDLDRVGMTLLYRIESMLQSQIMQMIREQHLLKMIQQHLSTPTNP